LNVKLRKYWKNACAMSAAFLLLCNLKTQPGGCATLGGWRATSAEDGNKRFPKRLAANKLYESNSGCLAIL